MFRKKCKHAREDGLPLVSRTGLCEECGARVRRDVVALLHSVYDARKARALASPPPSGACKCPPLKVRVGSTRVAIPVPKQSPLHQLGCPDWYVSRTMGGSIEED